MDVFTHALLPLAAYLLLARRSRAEGLAAGLGAAAPDMDVFLSWAQRLGEPFWWTVHRGWSHTLWGAPLAGLVALWVLSRPGLVARWPRLAAFEVTPATVLAALLGAWSHLALDALTISGVPLFWPLSAERFTFNLLFFSVPYVAVFSGWAMWRLYRQRLDDTFLRRVTAVVVALTLLAGGVRASTMPDREALPEGAVVVPAPFEGRWLVAEPLPAAAAGTGGWRVRETGLLLPEGGTPPRAFPGNATAQAGDAVRAAMGLGSYTAWSWSHKAPVVNATPLDASAPGSAGWRVEFRDAFGLYREATPTLGIGAVFGQAEPLVIEVRDGEARVAERAGGFGFG